MGKVTYAAGIDTVSGSLAKPKVRNGHSCGSYLIGTHRVKATQTPGCTRLYIRKGDTYKRSTPLSQREMNAQARFSSVQAMVNARAKNLNTISQDQAAFMAQKDIAGGKSTFKAYLWSVCGAEYDAQH